MSALLAIDVGLTGAVALYLNGTFDSVWDIPTIALGEGTGVVKERIAGGLLRSGLRNIVEDHATTIYIERQQAMPKQGASSGFSLGMSFGITWAVAESLMVPVHLVNPQQWKKSFNLKGKDKAMSIARAMQEVPTAVPFLTRKKDHNRADAILIGLYALRNLNWKGLP